MSEVHNLVIVGSGPAGYTAAVYAARAQLSPIVYEGSITAGGALMNTTEVENFPGFKDGIMGPELMEEMKQQAKRFGTEIIQEFATKVELGGQPKKVEMPVINASTLSGNADPIPVNDPLAVALDLDAPPARKRVTFEDLVAEDDIDVPDFMK